jgi:hypothetical protein
MSDDSDERPEFGTHWGDWGVIIIAVVFTIAFMALMFGPSPLKGIEKFDTVADKIRNGIITKAEEDNRQKEIHAAEASGVVEVGIASPKKH